jgi:hypothetical protein
MSRPENGRFTISTKTEEELCDTAGATVEIATSIAVVVGAVGVVRLALGLLGWTQRRRWLPSQSRR